MGLWRLFTRTRAGGEHASEDDEDAREEDDDREYGGSGKDRGHADTPEKRAPSFEQESETASQEVGGLTQNVRFEGFDTRRCTYRIRKTLRIGSRGGGAAAAVATVGADVTAPLPRFVREALDRLPFGDGDADDDASSEGSLPVSVRPAWSLALPLGPPVPPAPPPGTRVKRRRRRKAPLLEGVTLTMSQAMVEVRKPLRADNLGYFNSSLTVRLGHQFNVGKPIFACDVAPDKPELGALVAVGLFLSGGWQRYARGEVPIDWFHVAVPLGSTRRKRIPPTIAPRIPMTIRRGNPESDPSDDAHLIVRATGFEIALNLPA